MKQSLTALLAFATICRAVEPTPIIVDAVPQNLIDCKRANSTNLDAYYGWPLDVTCEDVLSSFHESPEYPDWMELDGKTAACVISSIPSGEVVSNKTFSYSIFHYMEGILSAAYFVNVTEDSLLTYVARFEITDYCWYQIVHLTKMHLPALDCRNPPDKHEFPAELGHLHSLGCPTPNSLSKSTVNHKWIYNCGEDFAANASPKGDSLVLSNSSFANVGEYVCVIEYDGKEMAILQHDVCITYRTFTNDPIPLFCPETVYARRGEDAVIRCDADVGVNKANTILMGSAWYSERNSSSKFCVTLNEGITANSTEGSRIQCSIASSLARGSNTCYRKQPDAGPPHDWYTINLTIRDVDDIDFGVYRLQFGEGVQILSYFNVTLAEDLDVLLAGHIAAIAVSGFVVLLILMALIICVWRKHDVQWYWKKHFGPYDTEIHQYMAYFAYYFDPEKMGDQSKKLTDVLVKHLYDFIDKFGGAVYDDQMTPNLHQYDADNILQAQGDCHRVVMVLSPEYITDHWNLHKTYTALNDVVKTGKKVIFITLPGIKKGMSVLDDAPRKTLIFAMKKNITIHWSGEVPFSGRFRRRLEYAFPKLPKPGYDRCFSGSSQTPLTHHNKHAERSFSSSTDYKNGFSSVVV